MWSKRAGYFFNDLETFHSLYWAWKELIVASKIKFGLDIVATSQEGTKPQIQNYI